MVCPNCGTLISTEETRCPECNARHPNLFGLGPTLNRLFGGRIDVLTLIPTACIALYVISLLLDLRSALNLGGGMFNMLSPGQRPLILLGMTFGDAPWFTVLTATYLHGSLLHILFNMMALKTVAPFVIREFGSSRTFSIYTLAGAGGFLASYLGHVPLTVGASSGICGLIGALLFYGKSRGGQWGQLVVRQTSGWVISLILVGVVVPRVNNWGHGGGFVTGIALAWILGYLEMRRESLADKVLALLLAALSLFLLARTVVDGAVLIFF